jgi:succinyl-diaminopimelate desuccinylase
MDMREDILSLTKKLIAIPSISGDIEKAVEILEFAKEQLPSYDFTPFVSNSFPSLLYTNQKKQTRKCKIIFNAHLDVVPHVEYKPYEKDGKLYGRGALDMKAAAAVMILLFKELADKLSYPLGLQLVTDEELGGGHGTKYQVEQNVRADFAIMGDMGESNSNFQIANQAKGVKFIKLKMMGSSAHAAYPWQGKNAIWKMYQALEPLMKAFPIPEKEIYETTVTITKIETENGTNNKTPDFCVAYLDVRFIEKDKDTIFDKIRSFLPKDIIIEPINLWPTLFIDPKNIYIKQLKNITTEVIGKDLPLRFAHATSDAPFFSEVGCAAVEFGPIGQNAHKENEWVDIQSLVNYYQILKTFLLQIDKPVEELLPAAQAVYAPDFLEK